MLKAHVENEELRKLGAVGVEDGALEDGEQSMPCILGAALLVAAPAKHTTAA